SPGQLDLSPQRHRLRWKETDATGRTGQTPDGWTPDGWTPDGWTADGRPPDLLMTTPGDRTPDGWTAGSRTPDTRMGGHRMLDTGDCRRGLPLAVSTTATTPDLSIMAGRSSGQTPSGRAPPGPLSSKDAEGTHAATDGSGHRRTVSFSCRWYAAIQLAPRRTAVLGRFRVERRAAWWLPSGTCRAGDAYGVRCSVCWVERIAACSGRCVKLGEVI